MATVACAFCGTQQAASTMDMTGHGWRCVSCAARSELSKARGGSDMAEHLTPNELRGIVQAGGNEAWAGAGLGLAGVALTALSFSSGGQIVVVFTGMMFGGFAMLGHGLHRRKKAAEALRHFPSARAIDPR
jgi:hypothetical protein